jgi:Fe2+ transport system protein B
MISLSIFTPLKPPYLISLSCLSVFQSFKTSLRLPYVFLHLQCRQVDSVMIGIRLPLAFLPVYINIIIEAIKILRDTQASAARSQEVSTETFGAMVSRFDGKIGAFAYLLFILLYFPCVAAFGAMMRIPCSH